jgi:hypothetical protein
MPSDIRKDIEEVLGGWEPEPPKVDWVKLNLAMATNMERLEKAQADKLHALLAEHPEGGAI